MDILQQLDNAGNGAQHSPSVEKNRLDGDVISIGSEDPNTLDQLVQRLFHKDHLDRKLYRPQITGIAFAGTIGIGLFVTSGELIAIGGSLGCVLGFIIAGIIITSVMRSLAEMVSVRPVSGALIDYPHTFVDEALGFAVGVIYCLAQCISMAVLTASAAGIAESLKPSSLLAWDVFGAYSGPVVFLILLTGYKLYHRTNLRRIRDFKDIYFIHNIPEMVEIDDRADRPRNMRRNWKYWLSETWSLIK